MHMQFFDKMWVAVFFNLRTIGTPVSFSWVLMQGVSCIYSFLRNSGIEYALCLPASSPSCDISPPSPSSSCSFLHNSGSPLP
jgi:hypothetical protein